jgi:ribonuclease P protein component
MKPYRPLTRAEDFQRLSRRARPVRAHGLAAYALRREGSEMRLGIAARATTAVERNRIKRRVRAAVTHAGARPGTDLLVRADAPAARTDFQELVRAVRAALREAA